MKFISELSKGKLAGHPIHVMLVHFPLALFPVSLLFDLIYFKSPDSAFSTMSFYCLVLGLAGGYMAAIFGMIDLINLKKDDELLNKALIHAGVNSLVIFSYTILAFVRYKQPNYLGDELWIYIGSNVLLNLFLIVGAHYGGDLVFRYRVGVKE
jgi:uncharacterized membrane protein